MEILSSGNVITHHIFPVNGRAETQGAGKETPQQEQVLSRIGWKPT